MMSHKGLSPRGDKTRNGIRKRPHRILNELGKSLASGPKNSSTIGRVACSFGETEKAGKQRDSKVFDGNCLTRHRELKLVEVR